MSGPDRPSRRWETLPPRTRSWLWTSCAASLVLIYLVLWGLYSMTHLSAFARYDQLGPGQSAQHLHADFRLLSLVQAEQLTAHEGDPQSAAADTVFVLAELEVVPQSADPDFACLTELLGPGGRVWTNATLDITRTQPTYCSSEDVHVGHPYRFEQVYEVPVRYADQIYGVVIVNHSDSSPNPVLRPPV